ncbi:hypothetical protein D3C80_1189260 [compost metagenome]
MAQVWLGFVQAYPHFQPGLPGLLGEQIGVGQCGQLRQQLGQRCRAQSQQLDRARNQVGFDALQGFAVAVDLEDLVRVIDLRE